MGGARARTQRSTGPARVVTRWLLCGLIVVLAMAPALLGQMTASAQAGQPHVTILSPTDAQVVTDNSVAVVPRFANWNLRCDLAGTPNVAGAGHYHLELDGSLVNMFCGPAALSLQNVKPGSHTLTIYPAKNDHEEIEAGKTQVKFVYQPAAALPYAAGMPALRPSARVLWPRNGAAVSGATFPLVFDVRNFRLSCDLMGKPKLANTGHWHVDVDKSEGEMMMHEKMPMPGATAPPSGPKPSGAMPGGTMPGGAMGKMSMMSMATMLNMGCNNEFDVPLTGIGAGKHTFYVVLVDNLHEPLEPGVVGSVSVIVKK